MVQTPATADADSSVPLAHPLKSPTSATPRIGCRDREPDQVHRIVGRDRAFSAAPKRPAVASVPRATRPAKPAARPSPASGDRRTVRGRRHQGARGPG